MRCIIAGSREGVTFSDVCEAVTLSSFDISEVISGTAPGADSFGEKWAHDKGIPVIRMPANWKEYGRAAGYVRNVAMAEEADACIVVWNGVSKGSKHMMSIATAKGLKLYVHDLRGGNNETT